MLATALLLASRLHTAESTLVVVHDPALELPHQIAVELMSRYPGHVSLVSPSTRDVPTRPNWVVAIGEAAEQRASERWPDVPRASLLMWDLPSTRVASAPHLWMLAAVEPRCVASWMQSLPQGPKVILSEADDAYARALAATTGAELLLGDRAQQDARIRDVQPAVLWMRGAPAYATPDWLLSMRAESHPSVQFGSDVPGLASYGFEVPVARDPKAVVDDVMDWSRTFRKRRKKHATLVRTTRCGS